MAFPSSRHPTLNEWSTPTSALHRPSLVLSPSFSSISPLLLLPLSRVKSPSTSSHSSVVSPTPSYFGPHPSFLLVSHLFVLWSTFFFSFSIFTSSSFLLKICFLSHSFSQLLTSSCVSYFRSSSSNFLFTRSPVPCSVFLPLPSFLHPSLPPLDSVPRVFCVPHTFLCADWLCLHWHRLFCVWTTAPQTQQHRSIQGCTKTKFIKCLLQRK